ncbi:hypothetical protein [Streptomyces sp. NBC_00859]|uniref:hypothetical protein n=1 Tax=Streptomyces sp. NBC_00859 TaxID=2903682 RepID=UPI0038677368|nr:hypothetical protein OG584_19960 [Streptomyces sp. NBC_00859]
MNAPTHLNAPTHFKEQLADELNARAAALSAPAGHRSLLRMPRHRVALTVGLAAAAATVAVALPLTSGTPGAQQTASAPHSTAAPGSKESAAPTSQGASGLHIVNADYAVQSKAGGLVSVQLFSAKGVPGLQAALDKAGIPAKVMVRSASCPATGRTGTSPQGSLLKVAPQSGFHSNGARDFKPSAIVPGDHLLFTAESKSGGPVTMLSIRLVRQLPSCLPAD